MTELEKSTENLTKPEKESNRTLLLAVLFTNTLVSVIAIILAVVSLAQKTSTNINFLDPSGGGTPSSSSSSSGQAAGTADEKIWLLNVEISGFNYGYIDEATGELRGFSVDVVNAVCQIAQKNCEIVYDSQQRCWDSQPGSTAQGGVGLFGGYYDGCVGIIHSYDRPRTFRFSEPYTDNVPAAVLLVLAGNPHGFDWENLDGKKIGIIDGFVYDEHCLARADPSRLTLSSDQVVHYPTRTAAQQALADNEVDAIFDAKRLYFGNTAFEVAGEDISTCVIAGFSVMTRKDSRLIDWWNPAFEKLVGTQQWTAICNDLTDKHGHVRGGDASSCVGIE